MIIKENQKQDFARSQQKRFEDKMVLHIRSAFAEEAEDIEEAELREFIRDGIRRAFIYHIEIEADVARFIEYQFFYGEDFDTNEQLDWLQVPLSAEHLTGTEKMDIVDRLNYIALTSGD